MDMLTYRMQGKGYEIGVERRANGRIYFAVPFRLKDIVMPDIKDCFEGVKPHFYDPVPEKLWSVPETQQNCFRFQHNFGIANPYAWYDRPLQLLPGTPGAYGHQTLMTSVEVQYHQVIIGAEMGTGKTRATFDALKYMDIRDIWWVAPKSALYSLMLEQEKWNFPHDIRFLTYDGLRTLIHNWTPGQKAPFAVIFDEAQRLKSENAKRTRAAMHLADNIRVTYGREGIVFLLTGSPSPKSPIDLWSLARIACPGFLREGSTAAFKRRMCLIEQRTNNITGTTYPHLVTWWDDKSKCKVCGEKKESIYHNMKYAMANGPYHKYEESVNEVEKLAGRLKGLLTVVLKRDVLKELPEKSYRIIRCPVLPSVLRGAGLITQMNTRGATVLTLLREYSDGFQYDEIQCGEETCPVCLGIGTMSDSEYVGPEFDPDDWDNLPDPTVHPENFKLVTVTCGHCNGELVVPKFSREAKQIPTPKEQVLSDLFEEFEETGRMVVWAGFQGSIDRCRAIAEKKKWDVIVVDGRGWRASFTGEGGKRLAPKDMLQAFQSPNSTLGDRNICYIGHPGAGGTGVTLTASPVAVYYSNSFNYEERIQSEDRIHRLGMDVNKGATIIDIIHLPSDQYVLDNLMRKQKLQAISIGDLHRALNTPTPPDRGYGVHVRDIQAIAT